MNDAAATLRQYEITHRPSTRGPASDVIPVPDAELRPPTMKLNPTHLAARQSEAKSDVRPGGAFSMFNGTVSGTYREVTSPNRIVQDWRFNHWPDGMLSKVRHKT